MEHNEALELLFKEKYIKGRKLVEIQLLTSVGDLLKVYRTLYEELRELGIKPLTLMTRLRDDEALVTVFLDVTNYAGDEKSLRMCLEAKSHIRYCKISKFSEVGIDEMHFPYTICGERALILPSVVFTSMERRLVSIFESGAVPIIFEEGKAAGSAMFGMLSSYTGMEAKELVNILSRVLSAMGFGKVEIVELDLERGRGLIRIRDSHEAIALSGVLEGPCCHFTRGFITGMLSEATDKEVKVEEILCLGKGDPYCEFRIKFT